MTIEDIFFGVFVVVMVSLVWTLLDKKFPFIRIKQLYHEDINQNFFMNIIFASCGYAIGWFLLG